MVNITINGEVKQYPKGTTFEKIADDYQAQYDNMIALVLVNGKIQELIKTVREDAEVSYFTLKDNIGHKAYVRTAIMTMIKSVYDVLGEETVKRVKVEFVVGQGYYCSGHLFIR